MPWILVAVLVLLALIWGLASISQSYAAAQQAQAAIEASRTAQIASLGNLLVIVILVLLVLVLLAGLLYACYQLKVKTGAWKPGPNARWGRSTPDPLPALLTMLLYQMLQQQSQPSLPISEPEPLPDEFLHDLWMS